MRSVGVGLLLTLVGIAGCASVSSDLRSLLGLEPGLQRVEADLPGVLELRDDHRIGGFDALLIPPATISYRYESLELTRAAERTFLSLLRESLVEATEAAAIPIVETPGPCVMEVRLRVSKLDLDYDDDAEQLADMTVVMQFRDSTTRLPLLRYAAPDRVPSPQEGVTRDARLRRGLARIVRELNVARALGGSGIGDDQLRPGCEGTLAKRGREQRGETR